MGELLHEVLSEISASPVRFAGEVLHSLLLIGVLWWAGRRYAGKRLATRREGIVAALAEADRAVEEAKRLRDEAAARRQRARDEAPGLIRAAEEQGASDRELALARVEEEAGAIVQQARLAVERDKTHVAEDAAGRLVELTAEATRRYLDEMLSESERRALTQQAILATLEELRAPPRTGNEAR